MIQIYQGAQLQSSFMLSGQSCSPTELGETASSHMMAVIKVKDKRCGEWCLCVCVCTYVIAVHMHAAFTVLVATAKEHCSSLVCIRVCVYVCVCDTVPSGNDTAAHPNNPKRQTAG